MNARNWLVVGCMTTAVAGTAISAGGALAETTTTPPDRTSAAESRKVDAMPTPRLIWAACFEIAECATVELPLDYDQPRGATTDVGVLRIKARDQANRIGSLFVNLGGPGLSATECALGAALFMSDELLDRFDIVGVDPRGIGAGRNVRCFASAEDQAPAAAGLDELFPVGGSYGSVLGQYYANMFPDRFRALAIDGVIDARAWVGNTRQNLDERINSSGGASRTLTEILRRCDRAGEKATTFAGEVWAALDGDTTALLQRLRTPAAGGPGHDGPDENGYEAIFGVICADGRFPAKAAHWPAAVAAREEAAPYFGGSALAWKDTTCASSTWTVRDEDAYTGPFNRRTAAPVLVVGSFWDPATNYAGAVSTSRRMPNARLLSSDNWGHTAYALSACATAAIDAYLLTSEPPAKDTVCADAPERTFAERRGKQLAPVARPQSMLTVR